MEVARLVTSFESKGVAGVLADTGKVEGALNRVGAAGSKAGGAITGAFSVAGGVLGAQVVGKVLDLGKSFLFANASAEQYKISLETVTGSQAKANRLFTDLQKFAAATPFEFPELVQASINLEAFGLKTQDWINTVGDTASAMGKSVDQVTQAVLDAATGQYERLKELGVSAQVEGDKLHLMYMKNGKQINEYVDKNNKDIILKTIQGIWNDKYEGAMKKQSKTFLGQWSTLKDNFKMTMQRMTGSFFDFSKGVLSEGNELFNLFNKKLAAGLDPVHAALSALHVTLDQVFGKSAGDVIDRTLRGIVDGATAVVHAVGTAIDVLSAMGGALLVDLKKGDIAGFFVDLRDDFLFFAQQGINLGEIVVNVGKWIPGAIDDLWSWLMEQIGVTSGGNFIAKGDGTEVQQPISIGDVLVNVGNFVLGTVAGWAADTGTKIQAWIDTNKPGSFVTAIDLTGFNVAFGEGASGNWSQAVKDLLETDPVQITPQIELRIEENSFRQTRKLLSLDLSQFADLRISTRQAFAAAAIIDSPAAMAALAVKIIGPDAAAAFSASFKGTLRAVVERIGPISIPLPSWRIALGVPEIVAGGIAGIGNAFGFGLSLSAWILEKIGGAAPDVTLPSWHLHLPSPSDITGPIGGEISAQIGLWVGAAVAKVTDVAMTLPPWKLSLPTPEFPNFTSALDFLNWFEPVLDSFDYVAEMVEGIFHINLPTPDFPGIAGIVLQGLINALAAIGDLVVSFPGSISVNVGSIIPHGSFTVPFGGGTVSFAKGGEITSPFALVGERGPELIRAPRGSYVYTAAQTRNMMGGGGDSLGGGSVVHNHYYLVDLTGAVVGRKAMDDLRKLIEEGTVEVSDARQWSSKLAGR